jgi:hypothetical protein
MNGICYVSICIDFDVEDGLMAGIQIGVNATADYTDDEYYAVATDYQAGGGVAGCCSLWRCPNRCLALYLSNSRPCTCACNLIPGTDLNYQSECTPRTLCI